ncbi:hypothetical protein SAMN05421881_10351, partial [Nitrosomonas halophila]
MRATRIQQQQFSCVDTLSSVKQNLHISALYFEKLVTIKRHVVMQ